MKRRPNYDLYHKLCLALAIAAWLLSCSAPATPPSVIPTPPNTDNPPYTEIYRAAAAHITAGEYSAAETLYHAALQEAPNDPQPALQLAQLYQMWNRPAAGLAALDEAARRKAPVEEITPLRLELLALNGNWADLITTAEAHLITVPNDSQALKWLTRAYLHTYQCATADTTAQRWYDAAPDDLDARLTLGALGGDISSLCEADARFCILPPTGDDLQLGITLIRDGNWPLAACVLTRAAATDDAPAEAHAWLGEALARLDRPQEAQPHFLKATTLAPRSPLAWLLLGLFYLSQQQTDNAVKALLQAHNLDPTNPLTCLSLAEAKAQAGHYDEVDAWIGAALDAAPTDADVAKTAARFYLERHLIQNEYPLRPIQSAIKLAPEDGEATMLLGWFKLMTGDTTGARETLDKAVALAPELGQAHYWRGLALEATGETQAAQAAFTRATDLGYVP